MENEPIKATIVGVGICICLGVVLEHLQAEDTLEGAGTILASNVATIVALSKLGEVTNAHPAYYAAMGSFLLMMQNRNSAIMRNQFKKLLLPKVDLVESVQREMTGNIVPPDPSEK